MTDTPLSGALALLREMVDRGEIAADSYPIPNLSTVEGYRKAYDAEIERCGDPIPERDQHLLDLLLEEFSEVSKERSKLRRSGHRAGFRKLSDPGGPTVMQRMVTEVYDTLTLIHLLEERGYINVEDLKAHEAVKLERLRRFSPEIF